MKKRREITLDISVENIVKGVRGSRESCPIANSLIERGMRKVLVGCVVEFYNDKNHRCLGKANGDMLDFEEDFDNGRNVTPMKTKLVYWEHFNE